VYSIAMQGGFQYGSRAAWMLDFVRLRLGARGARTPWGGNGLRQKAEAVGLDEAYLAVFGGMSHNVRSWHDLHRVHLETDENGAFTPNLEWGRPRPQPLFALGHLALGAVADFLAFIGGEEAIGQMREKLRDLDVRINVVDQAHEAYLSGETWPAI
jgi:hypothetical protein